MEKSRNVELDIIVAAKKVFQEKGYKEATMRDIAAQAKINLAMLHYYFRSKDNLFFLVFDESLKMLYDNIVSGIENPEIDIFEKIRIITGEYITFFNKEPALPPFVVGEIIRNPENIGKRLLERANAVKTFEIFTEQLQKEYEKGFIKQISPFSLVLNIISLCIFPAISKPVIQEIFNYDNASMNAILEARKQEVADFVINAIKA